MHITKKIVGAIAATVMLTLLLAAYSFAVSPSERDCEAAGGTFDRTNGQVSCVTIVVDPVGNSERSGGKSQTTDTETNDTGQGNSGNKPASTETCTGPGGSGVGGGPCK